MNIVSMKLKFESKLAYYRISRSHCRTIPDFEIFETEHFLFVIVSFNNFKILILFILN